MIIVDHVLMKSATLRAPNQSGSAWPLFSRRLPPSRCLTHSPFSLVLRRCQFEAGTAPLFNIMEQRGGGWLGASKQRKVTFMVSHVCEQGCVEGGGQPVLWC